MKVERNTHFYDCNGYNVLSIAKSVEMCFSSKAKVEVEGPCQICDASRIACGHIGAFTFINEGVHIRYTESIGRYCSIAPNVRIGLPTHPAYAVSSSDFFYSTRWKDINPGLEYADFRAAYESVERNDNSFTETVKIGNDVWIGYGAIVMKGVTIGDGAIIGAGAVVTKDVEPYTIVGGIPAKKIKYRFDERMIERLKEIQWWNYSPCILEHLDYANVTSELLDEIERRIKNGCNKYYGPLFVFDPINDEIFREEKRQKYILQTNKKCNVEYCTISGNSLYNTFNGQFLVRGWALPSYVYDEVIVMSGEKCIGQASLNMLRRDVYEYYPNFGDSRCGWQLKSMIEDTITNITVVYKKKGNEVYRISKTIECITPLSIIRSESFNIDCFTHFEKGTQVRIIAESMDYNEIKEIFCKSYEVVDSETCSNLIVCTTDWKRIIVESRENGKNAIPFWKFCVYNNGEVDKTELASIAEKIGCLEETLIEYLK